MNPLSTSTILPPPHWKLRSPPLQRSARFSEKLDKFRQNPETLDEIGLNDLVDNCMSKGDVDALRSILPHVKKLDITAQDDERAWWTLLSALSAMPEPCSINEFHLKCIHTKHNTASLLLEAMRLVPDLKSLHFEDCDWDVAPGELTCPDLSNLQEFGVTETKNAFSLLALVLPVSQPTSVTLFSNPDVTEGQHADIARFLSAQPKLCKLTLKDLLAVESSRGKEAFDRHDKLLATVLAHYTGFLKQGTATLKVLDFSHNPFGTCACAVLHEALSAKTTPINLLLAGCWRWGYFGEDRSRGLGELIELPRLVSITLCKNDFSESAQAFFVALAKNEGLRRLNLQNSDMDESMWPALAKCLKTMNLTTLYLPLWHGDLTKELVEAMDTNDRLRTVFHGSNIEDQRSWMNTAEFDSRYPNYSAFMARVRRNWYTYQATAESKKNGMAQFLAHMGSSPGQGPRHEVSDDIALYATQWSLQMNGAQQTQVVSVLNKNALPKD